MFVNKALIFRRVKSESVAGSAEVNVARNVAAWLVNGATLDTVDRILLNGQSIHPTTIFQFEQYLSRSGRTFVRRDLRMESIGTSVKTNTIMLNKDDVFSRILVSDALDQETITDPRLRLCTSFHEIGTTELGTLLGAAASYNSGNQTYTMLKEFNLNIVFSAKEI